MSENPSKPVNKPAPCADTAPAEDSKSGARSISYKDAGVDINAGNALVNAIKPLAASTRRPGAEADLGGFGGLFDLKATGFKDPVLVAANDGVGTKLKIAIDTGVHDTIGIDLVAMCVNDLIVQGAEPLFFLDYFSSGKLELDVAAAVVSGIAEGCRQAHCALIGGETAEMPGLYAAEDYDLAGFCVGAVERDDILPRRDLQAGDHILALASSGPHSNGYSLIRRLTKNEGLAWDAPAPFAPNLTLGQALITPTRIYVRSVLQSVRETGAIKALAHITGGGLQENIPRVLPAHLAAEINLAGWRCPAVFHWLQRAGNLDRDELLRTFNAGIGMIAIAAPDEAEKVASKLTACGETVYTIGRLAPLDGGSDVRFTGNLEFAT